MHRHVFVGLAIAALGACVTGRPVLHDFNAIRADRISPGMTRKFVMADQSTMAIYNLNRGAVVPVHSHDSEQLTYVQSGRLRIAAGGEVFDLRPGQVLVIPAGLPHSIEALENTVEYDYFAPPRRQWIEDQDANEPRLVGGPPGSRQ